MVYSVHPLLVMSMTRQAGKFPVIYLIRVTLFASYPAMHPAKRELVMTKTRPCPVCGRVARGAVRPHTPLVFVILLMTALAAHVQLGEMLRFVTILAGYCQVLASERERTQIMVKLSIFPGIRSMTLATVHIHYVFMEIDLRSLGLVAIEAIDAAP